MGGRNSMDLCQLVHEAMLWEAGCLKEEERLEYKIPPPAGRCWEGAHADDHIVCQRLSYKELHCQAELRDTEIVQKSVESYLRNGARLSADKRFRYKENFIAWGTQVWGRRGLVGSTLEKRHQIAVLVFEFVCLRACDVSSLDGVLGSTSLTRSATEANSLRFSIGYTSGKALWRSDESTSRQAIFEMNCACRCCSWPWLMSA